MKADPRKETGIKLVAVEISLTFGNRKWQPHKNSGAKDEEAKFNKRTKYKMRIRPRSSISKRRRLLGGKTLTCVSNSGLSAYTTDQSLRQLFAPFARLIKDQQTQRPKSFGFITFESEDDAQKALKALNGKIVNGRLIFVETAKEVEAPTTSLKSNKD
ncbi:putative RNA recognition motif domain, nucleotide-binding alpha-beta plait domain superfamily [Arabidopsis thaliana]|uniref:RNA recognition motif domain n=1 Tax=Arabidopsis thaliana x Arabidopsis arenosa TaxID=1240361 RepID=A0A8T2D5F3_9BRAS|nr:RNA recognition motif domain [Arabidopsis thaliana x Arabidopsis arenosa]